jgi:acetyltransferase
MWGITMPYEHAKRDGGIALAAQSGNMALTTMLSGRLPTLAYAASLGNQAAVDVTDCLEFYLADPDVRVVALVIAAGTASECGSGLEVGTDQSTINSPLYFF